MPLSGRDGTRTRNLLLAKQLRSQLRHKPINIHLENLIKRTVGFYPLLIQYYPLFSHSDDKSEPQSRRSETSYRSSEEPKALRGLVYPLTFTHHSECYLQNLFFYKSLKTPNRALGYSHRRQVLTRFRVSIGSTPLFCVPCIYSHLADVVCRVIPQPRRLLLEQPD